MITSEVAEQTQGSDLNLAETENGSSATEYSDASVADVVEVSLIGPGYPAGPLQVFEGVFFCYPVSEESLSEAGS